MSNAVSLIDFTELISGVPGEGLEQLVRQLGAAMGLSPAWSGRGPDNGRDLIFTEILTGSLTKERVTWLVSCKDKSRSGDSVAERDLPQPGIKDKLAQHKASGFLLVTTTTVSTGAKALIDGLDKKNGGEFHTLVWDSAELTSMLLDADNEKLLKQYFPQSYRNLKNSASLEDAILSYRNQIPNDILPLIMKLVRPYSESTLKGAVVWPYGAQSAAVIDRIVKSLLVDDDILASVSETGQIQLDAFITLVHRLHEKYAAECYHYLFALVLQHLEPDIRFNAAQFLFDNYELNALERMELAVHLDSSALEELFSNEVYSFVIEEIWSNGSQYGVHQELNTLSQGTTIDDVELANVVFRANRHTNRIRFSGDLSITANLNDDGEIVMQASFPGAFSGYFDEQGMYIEDATVDTRPFYGERPWIDEWTDESA